MTNLEKLKDCFIQALALPSDAKITELRYQDQSWDSVGHMRLVAIIETTFNIMLTTDQILDLSSYTKARELVSLHGVSLEA